MEKRQKVGGKRAKTGKFKKTGACGGRAKRRDFPSPQLPRVLFFLSSFPSFNIGKTKETSVEERAGCRRVDSSLNDNLSNDDGNGNENATN